MCVQSTNLTHGIIRVQKLQSKITTTNSIIIGYCPQVLWQTKEEQRDFSASLRLTLHIGVGDRKYEWDIQQSVRNLQILPDKALQWTF